MSNSLPSLRIGREGEAIPRPSSRSIGDTRPGDHRPCIVKVSKATAGDRLSRRGSRDQRCCGGASNGEQEYRSHQRPPLAGSETGIFPLANSQLCASHDSEPKCPKPSHVLSNVTRCWLRTATSEIPTLPGELVSANASVRQHSGRHFGWHVTVYSASRCSDRRFRMQQLPSTPATRLCFRNTACSPARCGLSPQDRMISYRTLYGEVLGGRFGLSTDSGPVQRDDL